MTFVIIQMQASKLVWSQIEQQIAPVCCDALLIVTKQHKIMKIWHGGIFSYRSMKLYFVRMVNF